MNKYQLAELNGRVFFGEHGLTSTSANHIANMAKEHVQNLDTWLKGVNFCSETICIIYSDATHVVKNGWSKEELDNVVGALNQISLSHALIAWLREAIKAKQNIQCAIDDLGVDELAEMLGIEVPQKPTREPNMTEEEANTQSVKERNEYLTLKAKAAVLGKFAHEDGAFNKARRELSNIEVCPNKIKGEGQNMTITHYQPSVSYAEVDSVFFEIQKEHRQVQAQINGYLHKIETLMEDDKREKGSRYFKRLSEYQQEMQIIDAKTEELRMRLSKEASELKIIIPNNLRGIYEIVNSLVK